MATTLPHTNPVEHVGVRLEENLEKMYVPKIKEYS
jgi:hypothetical protein